MSEWPTWTAAMDVLYLHIRQGNGSHVPTTFSYPNLSMLSLRLTSYQMIDNSAAISERIALRSSQCVFVIRNHR